MGSETDMTSLRACSSISRRAIAPALLLASFAAGREARADCTPTSPVSGSGTTVTCRDTTTNQNGTTGYGTATDTGNTYNIVSGASVTGDVKGLVFTRGTVNNAGTITGTNAEGISAGTTAGVINTGTILGAGAGIVAGSTAKVDNAGTITATGAGGFAILATIATVINSGTISATGTNGVGISAFSLATVNNTGKILSDAIGIHADTANVDNAGIITATATNGTGGNGTAIEADTTASVTNRAGATISGGFNGIF